MEVRNTGGILHARRAQPETSSDFRAVIALLLFIVRNTYKGIVYVCTKVRLSGKLYITENHDFQCRMNYTSEMT